MALIQSADADDRLDGLYELGSLIDEAFGDEGAVLGHGVRQQRGVAALALLLRDRNVEVQSQTMLVLGNLCSDAFDKQSHLTKKLLLQSGAQQTFVQAPYGLLATDTTVLVCACGCLQNLCHDAEWVSALLSLEVEKRLQDLLTHEDYRVVNYAAGALKNMLHRAGKADTLQHMSDEAREVRPRVIPPPNLSTAPTHASIIP